MNDSEAGERREGLAAERRGIAEIGAARHLTAHVWPRPSLLRCQRNQAGSFNSARAGHPNTPANWNAAPTEDLPVIRYDAKAGQRSLDVVR